MFRAEKVVGNPTSRILVVGNNPIELSAIISKLREIKGGEILVEIAFDVKSVIERLKHFSPDFVLIDDNIGGEEMRNTTRFLETDRHTRNTPIAVVKNSNYKEAPSISGALDFLLKKQLSPQSLYLAIKNALRMTRTRGMFRKLYTGGPAPLFS